MLQPDLPAFLKNNTKSEPTWQEIVDFVIERPALNRAH
jgi:hypothetical protein